MPIKSKKSKPVKAPKLIAKAQTVKPEQRIEINCECGIGEATKPHYNPNQLEQPWTIIYPWGDDTFYGSKAECQSYIKQAIADYDALESKAQDEDDSRE